MQNDRIKEPHFEVFQMGDLLEDIAIISFMSLSLKGAF